MCLLEGLKSEGYTLEAYSGWVGDIGKYYFSKCGTTIGYININNNTITALHGYCGGYLSPLVKKLNCKLIEY